MKRRMKRTILLCGVTLLGGMAADATAQQKARAQAVPSRPTAQTVKSVPAAAASAKVLVSGPDVSTSTLPAAIVARANAHLADGAKDFPDWQGATLATKAQPLYRPDLTDVAYYHIGVTRGSAAAGYMILSTGEHDMPIVQWSEKPNSPVQELATLAAQARKVPAKYYMLDALAFAAEDAAGDLIASVGDLPSRDRGQGAKAPSVPADWKARKSAFGASFAPTLAQVRAEAAKAWELEAKATQKSLLSFSCDPWSTHWAGSGEQRWYSQIPTNQSPNTSGCASGCGATAWAMLFGWADYKASGGNSPWQFSTGIFRAGGGKTSDPAVEAPKYMDDGVRAMTWEIRGYLGTRCMPREQGMTLPEDMVKAQKYLDERVNAKVQVDISPLGPLNPTWGLRDKADSVIRAGRPVILALGVEHYVLAYGYRKKSCTGFDKHEFKINEGWGKGEGRWTSANTWLVGQLHPAPNPNPGPSSGSAGTEATCPSGSRCCEPAPGGRCRVCRSNSQACP